MSPGQSQYNVVLCPKRSNVSFLANFFVSLFSNLVAKPNQDHIRAQRTNLQFAPSLTYTNSQIYPFVSDLRLESKKYIIMRRVPFLEFYQSSDAPT